jgi:inner membrane transporter RhtA
LRVPTINTVLIGTPLDSSTQLSTYIDPVTARHSSVRVSPIWLVLVGIASVQFGAAIAKTLFDEVEPATMVWLRLVTSAVVLALVARPVLRGRSREDWFVVLAFGATLGLMNWAIYQSFARIPLGIAVTIEFVGPLTLAVLGSRRARDLAWVLLAGLGVALLGFERADLDLAGVLFALLAGGAWAAYILLSAQTGRRWQGLDGLAMASIVATLLLTPVVASGGGEGLDEARILALGAAVGLLSSVIPYSCEMAALRTLPPSVFSILMSLEPGAAALAGILVVGEFLSAVQWLALGCVVVASIGATRSRPPIVEPAPD